MSLFVFWLLYMRSTFPGTELDFLLKLTRQPKNNPPLEREMGKRERKQGAKGVGSREGKGMSKAKDDRRRGKEKRGDGQKEVEDRKIKDV